MCYGAIGSSPGQFIKPSLIMFSSKRERRVKENRGLSSLVPASGERGERGGVSNPAKANNPRPGPSDTHNTQYDLGHTRETIL